MTRAVVAALVGCGLALGCDDAPRGSGSEDAGTTGASAGASATGGGASAGGSGSLPVEPPLPPEQAIPAICEGLSELACVPSALLDGCADDLAEGRLEDVANGCGPEIDAYLSCMARTEPGCRLYSDVVEWPACREQNRAWRLCRGRDPDLCDLTLGGGYCLVQCQGVAVSCTVADGATVFDCTCDSGPKQGTTFVAPSCPATEPEVVVCR